MLPVLIAAVYFVPHADVATADAAVLKRLDNALTAPSDKKEWFAHFEQQCPASHIVVWQRLQQQVDPANKHYGELSFALAYYGKDYAANVNRLIRPYRLWQENDTMYDKQYNRGEQGPNNTIWADCYKVWFALNLLYLKHHDLTSLGLWLEEKLDGPSAKQSAHELSELWKRHPKDMLRAASGSPERIDHLAESLKLDASGVDKLDNLLSGLRVLAQSADGKVATAARQVREHLQTPHQETDAVDKK